jgi:hypothetical protein
LGMSDLGWDWFQTSKREIEGRRGQNFVIIIWDLFGN